MISVTDDLVQEINKLIYRFVWRGTDQIKRCAFINDIQDGRIKMLDIQSMILARRVLIFKRYVDNKYENRHIPLYVELILIACNVV